MEGARGLQGTICGMVKTYTAKYTRIDAGYMGQLVEWPEVITEGQDIEDCRSMLRDALREMILACQDLGKEIPTRADAEVLTNIRPT